ncbi:MAG: 4'-phosphopantetheinyl transferase superfamily protein [Polyangiales bacterium]
MFHTVPDPEVLPAEVARCSIAIDLYDMEGDLARAFPGITLPERLHGAVRKRHIEYLAGRWCAREAMKVRHGHHAHRHIETGEEREPLWPDGVVGSITHTQGFVSAAIADARVIRGLGVDSEETFTVDRARRLARHLAPRGELTALARSGLDEGALAAAVFSVKESVYKCLHPFVKSFFGFDAAEVIELSREGAVRVRLTETLTREFREGYVLEGRVAITAGHVHTAIALTA